MRWPCSLTYHHDDYEIQSVVRKDNTPLGKLVTLVHQHFFKSLYVVRNELDYLVQLVFEPKVILLSAPMGSGKTTIAHKLQSILRERDDTFVHYINLKKVITQTSMRGHDGKPVCHYIYRDVLLKRSLFKNSETKNLYKIHRVREHEGFDTLALKINRKSNGNEDQEWLDVLNNDKELSQKEDDLDSQTNKDLNCAHENLRVILDFICKKTKYQYVVLVLDNTDRYSLSVQLEVVLKAVDIRGTSSILIAIRTKNLADLKRRNSDGRDNRDSDILRYEQLGIIESRKIKTGTDVLKHFIHKRTNFLNEYANDLELTELSRERLKEFLSLLDKVTDYKQCSVLEALDKWYNHSLRHIGSNLASFVGRLITDADPAHSFERICPDAKCTGDIDIHRLRNSLYKYLICGESLTYDDPNVADKGSDFFNKIFNIYSSQYSNKLLPFPEFALLIFISERANRVAFEDIASSFGPLNLKPDKIIEIIDQLRLPQGRDGSGFLTVEAPPGKPWQNNKEIAQIELLPTGQYFVNTFCMSCEYTFWMALDTNVKNSFFKHPFKGTINYIETKDDWFRALICLRFISDHVFESIKNAESYLTGGSDINSAYREIFPEKYGHLSKLVSSIKRFIDNIVEPSGYKEVVNKELKELQKNCEISR